ncbi:PREDICTED: serine/threonine-protein kinase 24-like [Amphimedon queenslandica]|uniref:non-specific serine/threonine protein kinase n=1 Tax=Amphimedon queenslandica TaxID=400682 RepID=A0A1X7UEA2_AMPQE|nr:PREDICTED: serine/threonine-protein kinase 24-like [Amphimedon queenslandica]|eukprot:XP_019854927.1 PREDICTED: serine/threonine-protein kinase 24-like [Amphimedon queenslandica]
MATPLGKSGDPEVLFTRLKKIGKGSLGEVFKGIDIKSKEVLSFKIIELEEPEVEIDDIPREISVQPECDSPYIAKYYGSYVKETKLWIVMEYLGGGSALDLMQPGPVEEVYIATILREVLHGLDYLHTQGKLHRDIKASNVLFSTTGQVKLTDFGVAGQLTDTMNKRNTIVERPFWMAPEVITRTVYDTKADIWSLGITAIELAQGQPPHADLHPIRALFLIPKSNPPELLGNYSESFKEFIAICLNKDPNNRPSARDLLHHKFMKYAKNTSCLVDLIERYKRWKASGENSDSNPEDTSISKVHRGDDDTTDPPD